MKVIFTDKDLEDGSLLPCLAVAPGGLVAMEIEERRITQKEFAKKINVHPVYLNRVLNGKLPITFEMAKKIEDALGINAETLVKMQKQYEEDRKLIKEREDRRKNITLESLYDELQEIKKILLERKVAL